MRLFAVATVTATVAAGPRVCFLSQPENGSAELCILRLDEWRASVREKTLILNGTVSCENNQIWFLSL